MNVSMIRDLAHVVKREKARIELLITLAEATKLMRTEAIREGYYETLYGKCPRIQILTIEELLNGKTPNVPLIESTPHLLPENKPGKQRKLEFIA